MFQFLFNYPRLVFSRGEFVLLSGWPKWLLILLLLVTAGALAALIRARLPRAAPSVKNWRVAVIWLLQSCLAALLLVLLWQPAIVIAQLEPQKNIIAVLIDDSRSMSATEDGATRLDRAVKALQGGVLTDLQKQFQTRLYRLDSRVTQVAGLAQLQASIPVTRIGPGLKQLAEETSDLPVGAVVLLSDGSDNSGGIDRDTITALRSRRIPVHTVGFGREQPAQDVEMDEASVAPRALAQSRLAATVRFHQHGYAGRKAVLRVHDGGTALASQSVTLAGDGVAQTENVLFNAGIAGAKTLRFSIDLLPGEENSANNAVTRLVNVESGRRRVLYVEGEPRWEYKFIRRAQTDDHVVQLVSMLRTTENKIYRQGIDGPSELAQGFPSTADELFAYQGLIIGSVEADYFTPAQRALIEQFVDRRGGGLLLLGGRMSLADGGWAASGLADLLPVLLPSRKETFHRDHATVELTSAGADSIICRLTEDAARNQARWKKLPYVEDYQDPGLPKPGAAELVEMNAGGRKLPLLVTENYGRGRTAVLATGGTWRWQMSLPSDDHTHAAFWQQLLRWLVSDTPGRVMASVSNQTLLDEGHLKISAQICDKDFAPAPDAVAQAHVTEPGGGSATLDLAPDPNSPGLFQAEWDADRPGTYAVVVTAQRGSEDLGSDALNFERVDGVAENFHLEQNRHLLESLSAETGGKYWKPQDLSHLAGDIPYSEA
ncbi:MAG: glutamine amidotransferase, partial [Thermoguttaceae bacterium]